MTTTIEVDARTSAPTRAVRAITWRLIRRSTVAIGIGMLLYVVLEGFAFTTGYPDEAARQSLTLWGQDPSIRMIAGPAIAVETVGGFIVWDAGLYFTLILGAWALTTTTRVLRGDEAAGRTDLLLLGPATAMRALLAQLSVLFAAAAGIGACVSSGFLVAGAQREGSILFGAWVAGYLMLLMAVAALASQLAHTRGAAAGASGALLAAFVLLRMVANSAASREWLAWLTPTGWPDQLRAFDDNRWPLLALPVSVVLALTALSLYLRTRRDTGAGMLALRERVRKPRRGLGSPMAFAWRSNLPSLSAWAAAIAVTGLVIGAMLPAIDEFLKSDVGFQEILQAMGMDPRDLVRGFIGMWGLILGVIGSVHVAFRLGAARNEEASGRADVLLVLPVTRWRWLGGHVIATVGNVLVLMMAAAISMWVSVRATDARASAGDVIAAMANPLPVVLVFLGLGVLLLGLLPRLAVAITATVAVAMYVLQMVGPLLEWPEWLLNLSPFRHLANAPIAPVSWTASGWLVAVALLLGALGFVAFQRRDLTGA